jgi:hypothetical protein
MATAGACAAFGFADGRPFMLMKEAPFAGRFFLGSGAIEFFTRHIPPTHFRLNAESLMLGVNHGTAL